MNPAEDVVDDRPATSPSSTAAADELNKEKEDVFPSIGPESPEGGQGWLVALGATFLTMCSFGLVNSWVFQAYYETSVLQHDSPSNIAWIGSLQYSLTLTPGLIAGRLFDLGYLHVPLAFFSGLLVVSTILVAECKVFAEFLVVQGLLTGIASGFVFGPSMGAVAHWFKRKRGRALGFVAAGSAIGGTIFPIAVRELLPKVGREWTMRIVGLILFVGLALGNILIRRRLPPAHVAGGLFNWAAFKSAPYTLYVLGSFFGFLGLYTPLVYFDVFGVSDVHLSPNFSFYLVSIANASSIVGRVASGYLSDRYGCINVLVPFNLLGAAMTFAWPSCKTKTSIITVAVLYGIASGAFVGLLAAPVAHMGETSDVGRRTGMLFTVVSIGALIGPPISGAIYSRYVNFEQVGVYAGCMVIICAILLFASKIAHTGSFIARF